MRNDTTHTGETAVLERSSGLIDHQVWSCRTQMEKFWIPEGLSPKDIRELEILSRFREVDGITAGQYQADLLRDLDIEPELVDIQGNLLMYGGASCQWQTLIGNGTATAGQSLTYFSNAQAAIGVGDTATAAAATQTDLLGATAPTNKIRVAMDSTYPQHTDGVVVGAASCAFKSTFSTSQANFAWNEWGVFNSATAGTGRMLNRKVESLGTKTSASTWALTVTLTLA